MSWPNGPSGSSTSDSVSEGVDALKRGLLVVFPTETVYGVGCAARDGAALDRLFVAKGRPPDRAVTVHLSAADETGDWAAEWTDAARRLADAFWPGPLTIVVPARADVPTGLRGGRDTVGLRVPDHPVAIELIEAFGEGIAGSSANLHGHSPAVTLEEARDALGGPVAAHVDGGPCRLGVGSTVVDLSGGRAVVLRAGALPVTEVERVLGEAVTQR